MQDYAHTAGGSVVHQFCCVNSFSFIGGGSVVRYSFFCDFILLLYFHPYDRDFDLNLGVSNRTQPSDISISIKTYLNAIAMELAKN